MSLEQDARWFAQDAIKRVQPSQYHGGEMFGAGAAWSSVEEHLERAYISGYEAAQNTRAES